MRPLAVFLFASFLATLAAAPARSAGFAPLFALARGSGDGQLAWMVKEGQIPSGFLLGPAAFRTLPEGDVVIADTVNRRLLTVGGTGKVTRTVDLEKVRAAAGLRQVPLVADLAVDAAWRLYLVDAANGSVVALDAEGKFLRLVGKAGNGPDDLLQATRVHATRSGDVFVEDQARMLTRHYDPKGGLSGTYEGFTGLLFDEYGNFCLPLYVGDPKSRELTRYDVRGEAPEPLAKLTDGQPIQRIAPLGLDAKGRLHFAYDTDAGRTYLRFDPIAGRFEKRRVPAFDNGLDLATPDWVSPAGDLYRVRFDLETCVVEKWAAPYGAEK